MYEFACYQQTLVTFKIPGNKQRHLLRHHQRQQPLPLRSCKCSALSKQGQRFMSSLAAAGADGDTSATNRLIKKFVAASPKSIALDALSHLLSPNSSLTHLSSLAFPLYLKIREAHWFDWNPKLIADVVALLEKQGLYSESKTLISDSLSKLKLRGRDLTNFYCNLVESHAKQNCVSGFERSLSCLTELVSDSNSVYIKKQAYKSMISGLCEMGRPKEAQYLIEKMKGIGVKPSVIEFRCVLYAFGKLGLFQEMQMILDQMESEGFKVDTVSSNMILSSYGSHNALPEIALWVKRMKELEIPFSSRTYNSVLNSCPTLMSMVDSNSYPTSIQELMEALREDEATVVNELIVGSSTVLDEAMTWDALEAKLDIHGMHLSSAYLIMLLWLEEIKKRLKGGNCVIPAEITVVCGSGKHSIVRGESPVKKMIKNMMVQMGSPMRIDRKNVGCFIAKGKVVKEWLN